MQRTVLLGRTRSRSVVTDRSSRDAILGRGRSSDAGLLLICSLTFLIHLIGTLAYSVRIAGSRTGRVALSLSLFNILILLSRTSNSFQAPLLAKRVEQHLGLGSAVAATADFRWLLLAATLATMAGAFLMPTFQRLSARYVGGVRPPSVGVGAHFSRYVASDARPPARVAGTAEVAEHHRGYTVGRTFRGAW